MDIDIDISKLAKIFTSPIGGMKEYYLLSQNKESKIITSYVCKIEEKDDAKISCTK